MRGKHKKEGPIVVADFLADVGHKDSAELRVKFRLAHEIKRAIESRGFTQKRVQALTGMPQSNVSKIVTGKVSGFSVFKLAEVLNALGKEVAITVRDRGLRRRQEERIELS
jgi:predicted XRE-type DNA-binding protein